MKLGIEQVGKGASDPNTNLNLPDAERAPAVSKQLFPTQIQREGLETAGARLVFDRFWFVVWSLAPFPTCSIGVSVFLVSKPWFLQRPPPSVRFGFCQTDQPKPQKTYLRPLSLRVSIPVGAFS